MASEVDDYLQKSIIQLDKFETQVISICFVFLAAIHSTSANGRLSNEANLRHKYM